MGRKDLGTKIGNILRLFTHIRISRKPNLFVFNKDSNLILILNSEVSGFGVIVVAVRIITLSKL